MKEISLEKIRNRIILTLSTKIAERDIILGDIKDLHYMLDQLEEGIFDNKK